MKKLIILFSLCQFLVACPSGWSDKTTNVEEQEELNRLNKLYGSLEAVYRGDATTAEAPNTIFPFELSFYRLFENVGYNSNGEPIVRPTLNVRYRRLDAVQDKDIILSVRYEETTKNFFATTAKSEKTGGTNVEPFSISGQLSSETLTGKIFKNQGVFADLNATIYSKTPSAPAVGEEKEEFDRLNELYGSLEAVYQGTATLASDANISFPFELSFYRMYKEITDTQSGLVTITPILKARYRRTDVFEEGDIILSSRYEEKTNEFFSAVLISSTDGNAISEEISINGKFENGQLTAVMTRDQGLYSHIVGTKTTSVPVAPPSQNEELRNRLESAYRAIAGTYKATLVAPDGKKGFPVVIKVFYAEELRPSGVLWPSLRANYTRPDLMEGIGERSLTIAYRPFNVPTTIAMISDAINPGGTVPNSQYLSVVGEITGSTLTADITDHRGYQGHIEATKQ